MMKSLFLALALTSVSLAGCTDDAAESDTVVVEPGTEVVTPPADDMMGDDMMADTTGGMMGDDAMMADSANGMMGDDAMMADTASTNM